MCGIVGLFLKKADLAPDLGRLSALMLKEMTARGPDSAGFAVYAGEGMTKVSALSKTGETDWRALVKDLAAAFGAAVEVQVVSDHAILRTEGDGQAARDWLIANAPDVSVLGVGASSLMFPGLLGGGASIWAGDGDDIDEEQGWKVQF